MTLKDFGIYSSVKLTWNMKSFTVFFLRVKKKVGKLKFIENECKVIRLIRMHIFNFETLNSKVNVAEKEIVETKGNKEYPVWMHHVL